MANLILIGPQNVGKSMTAHWIARASRAPRLSLDDRGQPWNRDNQASFKEAMTIPPSDPNNHRLFKLAEAESVQQCVASTDMTVIDFGAGHSVHDHSDHLEMVGTWLLSIKNLRCAAVEVLTELCCRIQRLGCGQCNMLLAWSQWPSVYLRAPSRE